MLSLASGATHQPMEESRRSRPAACVVYTHMRISDLRSRRRSCSLASWVAAWRPGSRPHPRRTGTVRATASAASGAADQTPAPSQQPPIRTGINFVRVDAIVTDKQGNPVHRSRSPRSSRSSRTTSRRRSNRSRSSRSTRDAQIDAPLPTQIRTYVGRGAGGGASRMSGCSCCCSTTTTSGAATTWRSASRSSTSSRTSSRRRDMVAMMYPLTPVDRPDLHARPRGPHQRGRAFPGT